MSNSVEPKRVLKLINSMGYKNVTARELKDFTNDLKKLMKYEQSSKTISKNAPQVIRAPENEINVTIIKEVSPKKCNHRPTIEVSQKPAKSELEPIKSVLEPVKSVLVPVKSVPLTVEKNDIQTQTNKSQTDTDTEKQENVNDEKESKRIVRLPSHIKNRNPKIVYKKGIVCGGKNGVFVRNTPTDLYKKYQEEWIKFKSFIPGENSRLNIRRSIRRKMQQKDENDAKVYVHFPDDASDH